MPITSSAKKALRQNKRRRLANISRRDAFSSAVKDFRKAVLSKNAKAAAEELRKAVKALDKAAKTNTIKKNKASRLKSRLQKALTKVAV